MNETTSFQSLLLTIANLSDQAKLRGDRASANILLSVAALLAEVQAPRTASDPFEDVPDLSVAGAG